MAVRSRMSDEFIIVGSAAILVVAYDYKPSAETGTRRH